MDMEIDMQIFDKKRVCCLEVPVGKPETSHQRIPARATLSEG